MGVFAEIRVGKEVAPLVDDSRPSLKRKRLETSPECRGSRPHRTRDGPFHQYPIGGIDPLKTEVEAEGAARVFAIEDDPLRCPPEKIADDPAVSALSKLDGDRTHAPRKIEGPDPDTVNHGGVGADPAPRAGVAGGEAVGKDQGALGGARDARNESQQGTSCCHKRIRRSIDSSAMGVLHGASGPKLTHPFL